MKNLSTIMEGILDADFDITDEMAMNENYLSEISGVPVDRIKYDMTTGTVTFRPKIQVNTNGLPYYIDLCPDTDLSEYGVRVIETNGFAGLNLSGEWNCKKPIEIKASAVSINNACKSCPNPHKCKLLSNVHISPLEYNCELKVTTGTKFKSVVFNGYDLHIMSPVSLQGIKFTDNIAITVHVGQVRTMDKYELINFPVEVDGHSLTGWKELTKYATANVPDSMDIPMVPDSTIRKVLKLPTGVEYNSVVFNIYTWGVVHLLPGSTSNYYFSKIRLGIDLKK